MKETKSPLTFFSTLRSLCFLLGALFLPISGWAAPIGDLGTVPSTSDFPTVYTAGDPTPIVAGLNAVAMLFGHGHVSDSLVGAGTVVMVLVSLAVFLIASIIKEKLLLAPWLINLLAMILLFYPTTSVRVVSYFDANGSSSAAPQYVDNIPLGVGYALGIAGAIDYRVTTGIETAFSLVSSEGNFMQLGTDGFAKPLKILLAMRTMYDCNVHQTTCQNLLHFMHYCKFGGANHSSTMDMSQLDTPPTVADTGIVGLINSQRKSYTLYFDPTSAIPNEPKLVPCGVAADGIIAQMKNYVQNNPVNEMFSAQPVTMAHDMATVTAQTDSATDTPNSTYTGANSAYDTYAQMIQNVTAQTGGDANTFMINQVFSPTVLAAIRADANPNAAVAFQQIMGEAYERARVSMAASGSMFVNFMTASMNLFTFMFGAFAPIIVLIGVAAGMSGLRIYGSYFIFGFWTQMWMPVAAIISYYTQVSFNSMIVGSRIKAMAFAPSQIDHLYDNIGNMLATAGTMMAATPLITLSLLTGSVFALTSLANRSSGSGEQYVDSNRIAPTVDKASNAGAIEDSYKRATGFSWVSSLSNGNASGPAETLSGARTGLITDAQAQSMPTVRSGTSISQGAAMVASATANFQKSLSAAADRVSSYQRSAGSSAATSLVSGVENGWRMSDEGKKDFSDRLEHSLANRQSSQQGTSTSKSANASGSVGGRLGTGDDKNKQEKETGKRDAGTDAKSEKNNFLHGGFNLGGGMGVETNDNQVRSTDTGTSLGDSQTYGKGHTASTSDSGTTRKEGRSGHESSEQVSAQEASRAVHQAQEAYSQMKSAENSLRSASQMGADSTVPLGTLLQRAQTSQRNSEGSLSLGGMAAGSTATIASGGDPDKRQALINKVFSGVDRSGAHNMSNVETMMRNVSRMVQSSDMAEQAVGYAVAGAVAKVVGYPGGGEGIAENASVLAGAAKDLEAVKESLAPSGAADNLASTSKLDETAPREIANTAKGLGANPENLAPRASKVNEGNVPSVGGQAKSVGNEANAGHVATVADQNNVERQGLEASIQRRNQMTKSPDNINEPYAQQTGTSDVEKAIGEVVHGVENFFGGSKKP